MTWLALPIFHPRGNMTWNVSSIPWIWTRVINGRYVGRFAIQSLMITSWARALTILVQPRFHRSDPNVFILRSLSLLAPFLSAYFSISYKWPRHRHRIRRHAKSRARWKGGKRQWESRSRDFAVKFRSFFNHLSFQRNPVDENGARKESCR